MTFEELRRAYEQVKNASYTPHATDTNPHIVHPEALNGPCLVCGESRP